MRPHHPLFIARSARGRLRYGVNLAAFAVTFPILFPFALLHELVHLAGFALMRRVGFRVEGVRLELGMPTRHDPLLWFSPISVTVGEIRLGAHPRWYHRASALVAALGPSLCMVAGLFFVRDLALFEGHSSLFYAAVLFVAVMAPSPDDLRAAHWSLSAHRLDTPAVEPAEV